MLQNNILHVRLRIQCRKKIHEGQDKSLRIGQSPPMMSRTLSGIIRELAQLSKICLKPCPNYLHDETINCRNGVGDPIKLLHDANFGLQNDFCKERERGEKCIAWRRTLCLCVKSHRNHDYCPLKLLCRSKPPATLAPRRTKRSSLSGRSTISRSDARTSRRTSRGRCRSMSRR